MNYRILCDHRIARCCTPRKGAFGFLTRGQPEPAGGQGLEEGIPIVEKQCVRLPGQVRLDIRIRAEQANPLAADLLGRTAVA